MEQRLEIEGKEEEAKKFQKRREKSILLGKIEGKKEKRKKTSTNQRKAQVLEGQMEGKGRKAKKEEE